MQNSLKRDENNGIVGGVLAGMAKHYNFDVSVLRIITVLLAFTAFPVILIYIICWILIPE
jgi:phage shock protein PspC (stress-responsive transcriptional regulator)